MTYSTLRAAGAALGVVLLAQAGHAQTIGGAALTLGYNSSEFDGADSSSTLTAFDADYGTGPFTFDLGLSYISGESDNLVGTAFTGEVAPKYWIDPNIGIGAYLSGTRLESDQTSDFETMSYGVEGTYRGAMFETSLFLGATDSDDLGNDVDISDTGLRLRYDVSSQLSLYGKGVSSHVETSAGDGDLNAIGIGATYDFANGLGAFGSYQQLSADDLSSDASTTSVGVAYNFSAAGRPIMLSGEYARLRADAGGSDETGHTFSLGATILLGDAQSKRLPGAGTSRNLAKSDRNALDALVSGY